MSTLKNMIAKLLKYFMSDNKTPEINLFGKITAGILLIATTVTVVYNIIAYWPDTMPPIKEGDDAAWYRCERFHISLIEKIGTTTTETAESVLKKWDSIQTINTRLQDSSKLHANSKDSVKLFNDSTQKNKSKIVLPINCPGNSDTYNGKIHLNTLLIILVALMGFLGNMIHIATSFTTFVGNGTFKRSWVLWYFVKPFTASALAIIVYIIIRAGFLNYGSGAAGVSLYGIMALSALAGLCTDKATEKLKDIFSAAFSPKEKDDRKDKLGDINLVLSPNSIPSTGESILTITGSQFNSLGIKFTIDGKAVQPTSSTDGKIEIKYIPSAEAIAAKKAQVVATDKNNNILLKKDVIIQ